MELQPPFDDTHRARRSLIPCACCDGLAGPEPILQPVCIACCVPATAALVAALAAGALGLLVLPLPGGRLAALLALAAVALVLWISRLFFAAFRGRESMGADAAAEALYQRRCGRTPNLPEKLQGVFWMAENNFPELMFAFDDEPFDAEKREIDLINGGPRNWTWSTDCCGLWEWFCVAVFGPCACSTIRFTWDSEYAKANILVTCCYGLCNANTCTGFRWTIEDITPAGAPPGSTLRRDSKLVCCPQIVFSYFVRKVIDGSGERLPAFDVMIDSLSTPEKPGVLIFPVVKTYMQYVQGGENDAPRQQEMGRTSERQPLNAP